MSEEKEVVPVRPRRVSAAEQELDVLVAEMS